MADIVLVHGLWNRGWSMAPMAARLRARGHRVMVFSYPTRSQTVRQHADDLHRFIEQLPDGHYHLAGHSMGGLVILDMLSRFHTPMLRRVVLMGTPLRGSALVERLEKMPGQKLMFGKARESLRKGFQQIPANHETGMIRGRWPAVTANRATAALQSVKPKSTAWPTVWNCRSHIPGCWFPWRWSSNSNTSCCMAGSGTLRHNRPQPPPDLIGAIFSPPGRQGFVIKSPASISDSRISLYGRTFQVGEYSAPQEGG